MIDVIIFLTILIIFVIIASLYQIVPWFYGAVFEKSEPRAIRGIVILTSPKRGDKIVELGSGDGEIVIALAKKGARVDGYEINPILVFISRLRIKRQKLDTRAKIYLKSFWKVNLSKYNKVVFFQYKTITKKLVKKFEKELKPDSKIISNFWKLPKWKLVKQIGKVYFYER